MYSSNVSVINVRIIFLHLANIKHFETVVLIKVWFPYKPFSSEIQINKSKELKRWETHWQKKLTDKRKKNVGMFWRIAENYSELKKRDYGYYPLRTAVLSPCSISTRRLYNTVWSINIVINIKIIYLIFKKWEITHPIPEGSS